MILAANNFKNFGENMKKTFFHLLAASLLTVAFQADAFEINNSLAENQLVPVIGGDLIPLANKYEINIIGVEGECFNGTLRFKQPTFSPTTVIGIAFGTASVSGHVFGCDRDDKTEVHGTATFYLPNDNVFCTTCPLTGLLVASGEAQQYILGLNLIDKIDGVKVNVTGSLIGTMPANSPDETDSVLFFNGVLSGTIKVEHKNKIVVGAAAFLTPLDNGSSGSF